MPWRFDRAKANRNADTAPALGEAFGRAAVGHSDRLPVLVRTRERTQASQCHWAGMWGPRASEQRRLRRAGRACHFPFRHFAAAVVKSSRAFVTSS
jgi:hypothetical protein